MRRHKRLLIISAIGLFLIAFVAIALHEPPDDFALLKHYIVSDKTSYEDTSFWRKHFGLPPAPPMRYRVVRVRNIAFDDLVAGIKPITNRRGWKILDIRPGDSLFACKGTWTKRTSFVQDRLSAVPLYSARKPIPRSYQISETIQMSQLDMWMDKLRKIL